MEMMKMIVGFLVIAAFALPAFATVEKDFITPEAIKMIEKDFITPEAIKMIFGEANLNLDEKIINALTGKIFISNPVIEEALLKHSNVNGGSIPCGESCFWGPCLSLCSCRSKVCYLNSLAN